MTRDPLNLLESCIDAALQVSEQNSDLVSDIDDCVLHMRIQWVERQITVLLNKLLAIQMDIDAGLSLLEMGFADSTELDDFLQDTRCEIVQLQSVQRSLKMVLGQGI